jgi:hypothetical protein
MVAAHVSPQATRVVAVIGPGGPSPGPFLERSVSAGAFGLAKVDKQPYSNKNAQAR